MADTLGTRLTTSRARLTRVLTLGGLLLWQSGAAWGQTPAAPAATEAATSPASGAPAAPGTPDASGAAAEGTAAANPADAASESATPTPVLSRAQVEAWRTIYPRLALPLQPLQRWEFCAPSETTLDEISVPAGQPVKAGELLGTLESAVLQSELKRAELAVREAELRVETAQLAGGDVELARTHLESEKLGRTILQKRLADYEVRSPFSGIIQSWSVAQHTHVRTGQPLVRVVDNSVWSVLVPMPRGLARVGDKLLLKVAGKEQEGTVSAVRPSPPALAELRLRLGDVDLVIGKIESKDSSIWPGDRARLSLKNEWLVLPELVEPVVEEPAVDEATGKPIPKKPAPVPFVTLVERTARALTSRQSSQIAADLDRDLESPPVRSIPRSLSEEGMAPPVALEEVLEAAEATADPAIAAALAPGAPASAIMALNTPEGANLRKALRSMASLDPVGVPDPLETKPAESTSEPTTTPSSTADVPPPGDTLTAGSVRKNALGEDSRPSKGRNPLKDLDKDSLDVSEYGISFYGPIALFGVVVVVVGAIFWRGQRLKRARLATNRKRGASRAARPAAQQTIEFAVGVGRNYPTLAEAFAAMEQHAREQPAAQVAITEAVFELDEGEHPGAAVPEFAGSIHIRAVAGATARIISDGSAPLLDLQSSGPIKLTRLTLDADDHLVAIRCGVIPEHLELDRVVCVDFLRAGVLLEAAQCDRPAKLVATQCVFRGGAPRATAIGIGPTEKQWPEEWLVSLRECRFFGPLEVAVECKAPIGELEIQRSIFFEPQTAVRLPGPLVQYRHITLANNTFYRAGTAIEMLRPGKAEKREFVGMFENLFFEPGKTELHLEQGMTSVDFNAMLATVRLNWSTRATEVVPPRELELMLFKNQGQRGLGGLRFASTDANSNQFLVPDRGSLSPEIWRQLGDGKSVGARSARGR